MSTSSERRVIGAPVDVSGLPGLEGVGGVLDRSPGRRLRAFVAIRAVGGYVEDFCGGVVQEAKVGLDLGPDLIGRK